MGRAKGQACHHVSTYNIGYPAPSPRDVYLPPLATAPPPHQKSDLTREREHHAGRQSCLGAV